MHAKTKSFRLLQVDFGEHGRMMSGKLPLLDDNSSYTSVYAFVLDPLIGNARSVCPEVKICQLYFWA